MAARWGRDSAPLARRRHAAWAARPSPRHCQQRPPVHAGGRSRSWPIAAPRRWRSGKLCRSRLAHRTRAARRGMKRAAPSARVASPEHRIAHRVATLRIAHRASPHRRIAASAHRRTGASRVGASPHHRITASPHRRIGAARITASRASHHRRHVAAAFARATASRTHIARACTALRRKIARADADFVDSGYVRADSVIRAHMLADAIRRSGNSLKLSTSAAAGKDGPWTANAQGVRPRFRRNTLAAVRHPLDAWLRESWGCAAATRRRDAGAIAFRSQGLGSDQCGTACFGIRAVSPSHDQPR